MAKNGRPPKWATPQDLIEKIEGYFAYCDKEKKRPNKAGLCVFLDTTRDVLLDYEKNKGEEFSNAIKRAYALIEEAWVQRLDSPAATGAIFYLKNAYSALYRDRVESDITSGGDKLQSVVYLPAKPSESAKRYNIETNG